MTAKPAVTIVSVDVQKRLTVSINAPKELKRRTLPLAILADLIGRQAKKSKAQLRREAAGESQGEAVRSKQIRGIGAAAIVQQGFAQAANVGRPRSRKPCTNLKKLRHRLRHPELHRNARYGRPASQVHASAR